MIEHYELPSLDMDPPKIQTAVIFPGKAAIYTNNIGTGENDSRYCSTSFDHYILTNNYELI